MAPCTARKVEALSPVPADIDIANSVEPFPIDLIASELGLETQHYESYGKAKAKVCTYDIFHLSRPKIMIM